MTEQTPYPGHNPGAGPQPPQQMPPQAQQQPYGQPAYGEAPQGYAQQPYPGQGYHPGPPKSHAVAIILSFFLGTLGIDRFYLGHVGLGIAKLLLSWATFGIWQLIDFIIIVCKGTRALKQINWQ